MGDGVNAIPAQLVGRHGVSLAGAQYVDTGIVDAFERTDRFTLFCVTSQVSSIYGQMIATADQAQDYKGFYLANESLNTVAVYMFYNSGVNYIQKYKASTVIQRAHHSFALTVDGTSTAAGVRLYDNSKLLALTTVKDTLSTGTIKNGKPILIGARHNGAAKAAFLTGNLHDAFIFPWELTAQQVQYLHRQCLLDINAA
jgi:hypothetical protein